jgi:ABC-type multidrug transport system ATPase subunit
VIDHTIIMDKGRILTDEPFDTLRERFKKITLTSLNGPMPAKLPFESIIDCQRSDSTAVLTVKDYTPDEIAAVAAQINCSAETKPLPLEDIYKIVLTEKVEV